MHRLYEKAMLWEMVEWQRNPMELVEIKGISKRRKRPIVLTVDQFYQILELLPQPYRTMVVRAVVHGRVKTVKTEYSEDELPLDPDFAAVLLDWQRVSEEKDDSDQLGEPTPLMGLKLSLSEFFNGAALPHGTDPAGLYPSSGMLFGGLPKVRSRFRRLVCNRQSHTEW